MKRGGGDGEVFECTRVRCRRCRMKGDVGRIALAYQRPVCDFPALSVHGDAKFIALVVSIEYDDGEERDEEDVDEMKL